MQYHYIREALKNSLIKLFYILITDMTADCLMKLLTKKKFYTKLFLLSLVNS